MGFAAPGALARSKDELGSEQKTDIAQHDKMIHFTGNEMLFKRWQNKSPFEGSTALAGRGV